jgi:hypothetical protein
LERLDASPLINTDERLLQDCSYRNSTDRMVILRCCGSQHFFLERVVFPFEILAFSCPPMSEVMIWSHGLYGPELLESFRSEHLLAESSLESAESSQESASIDMGGMFPTPSSTLRTTPWLQAS